MGQITSFYNFKTYIWSTVLYEFPHGWNVNVDYIEQKLCLIFKINGKTLLRFSIQSHYQFVILHKILCYFS